MPNKTVLDFPSATTPLAATDILYIIQGSGTTRDKQGTILNLQNIIGDALIEPTVTGSIDLSAYSTNVVVRADPAGDITLTFSGALPAGKNLFIWNVSTNIITTAIEGLSLTLFENEYQQWVSDGTNMIKLSTIYDPNVRKKKHIVFADSPYTVTDDENFDLYTFDSSGGAIVFNLPVVANNYSKKIKCKSLIGGNNVSINRNGSDTITNSNLTEINLSKEGYEVELIGDEDLSKWDILNKNIPFYIKLSDQKTNATNGGTFTSGAWQTRDINTEENDDQNIATVSANQITLKAGTYRTRITCPAFSVDEHRARLYDIDNAVELLKGTNSYNTNAAADIGNSIIKGEFTLTSDTVLEIQHIGQVTKTTNGFGLSVPFAGGNEIYTVAEFWKL